MLKPDSFGTVGLDKSRFSMALIFLSNCDSLLMLPSEEAQKTLGKTVVSLTSRWAADPGRWAQYTGEFSSQQVWAQEPLSPTCSAVPWRPLTVESSAHGSKPSPYLGRGQVEEAELMSHKEK